MENLIPGNVYDFKITLFLFLNTIKTRFIRGLGIKSWQLFLLKHGNIQMEVHDVGALGCINNADFEERKSK